MRSRVANEAVIAFKNLIAEYAPEDCAGVGNIFVDDMLYCIGISLDHKLYSGANGYSLFKERLLKKLSNGERINFKGEKRVNSNI